LKKLLKLKRRLKKKKKLRKKKKNSLGGDMTVSIDDIKKLRESCGAGMADCKKALEEAEGDFDKAIEYLRKKGAASAEKRADREAKEGYIASYSHGGRIAAMVEVNSETDFVSKNEDFRKFAMEIAMQVAAAAPQYVTREEVPADVIAKEKEIELEKIKDQGKSKEIAEKIIDGKIEKFYEQVVLLEQPYIKDPSVKIQDLLNEKLVAIGEKIQIRRFCRFELGK
jgi:elongation factor Ts